MTRPIRIVTVTYNSADVIGAFLASIPPDIEVVVVDNASTDATRDIVSKSRAHLVALPRNIGFGGACNAGAKGNPHAFVFFVNPDATLTPGCCDALLAAAARHPKAGAINPAILTPKGSVRLNRRSCIVPRTLWTDPSLARRGPDVSAKVHVLSGAAIFARQAAFEAVGGFDPRIFLYHEDDDLGVRLHAAGWSLRIEHSAEVSHIGGGSTGYSATSVAFKSFSIAQSRLFVEQKHGVRFAKLRGYGRGIGKFLSPLSWLSSRKRIQARAYLKGVHGFDAARYGPPKT